jgi:ArsR family transcriptional regulator, arsenate/arsenite/antimonite-responsive transcriptional repressor
MALQNIHHYTEDDIKIARFAKALGHPARIAILKHLASLDNCCFNEISKEIPLADSTVSQHLTELKNAGLIQGSIEPPNVKYCINYTNWEILRHFLRDFADVPIFKYETQLTMKSE